MQLKFLVYLTVIPLLVSCASSPKQVDTSGDGQTVRQNLEPGDFTTGVPEADVAYELLVAEIATHRGDALTAARFYLSVAEKSQDPGIASRAVRVASFANEPKMALAGARIWVKNDPENLEAVRVLAVLLIRNGQSDEAKAQIKQLLSADDERASRGILHVGAMLQREASKEDAASIADYIVELYPDLAESHYVRSTLVLSIGNPTEALSSIDKALAISADWIEAVTLRARVLIELNRNDEALSYLKEYLDKNPSADSVRLTYARALVDSRKLEEARNQFELLAVKMPDNEDVLFTLAMISMQFKDYDEANGYLQQLHNMGKSSPQIVYYLGQIAEQQEQDEKALEWYSKIERGEYYLDSQLRIAAVLARAKSLEEALEHLRAIEVADADEKREVLLFEGSLLRQEQRYQDAYDLYTNALNSDYNNDTEVLYARALVAERLNLVDVVVRDLTYIIEQEPDNAAAYNALGYTLADRTNRLEEALEYISKAFNLEPEDPAVIDSMGWVHYRLGDLPKALEYLSRAHELIKDGEVAAHYGEVLWMSGDRDGAIKVWKEAEEQFGDNETLKKTMERFGQ